MNAEHFFNDDERKRIAEIIATEDADPLTNEESDALVAEIAEGKTGGRASRSILRHHLGLLFAYNRIVYDDGTMARTLSIGTPIVPPPLVLRDFALAWGFEPGLIDTDFKELVPGHLYFIGLVQPLDALARATPKGEA